MSQDKSETKESREVKRPPGMYDFSFPFPPYDIQISLMKVAYQTFEDSRFGLLESPTGTGKSLSLICSALSWLRDQRSNTQKGLEVDKEEILCRIDKYKEEEELSGDWLSVQTKKQEVLRQLENINKQLEQLNKFNLRNEARRHAKMHNIPLDNYEAFNSGDSIFNRTLENSLDESRDENHLITNSGCADRTLLPELSMFEEEEDDLEKSVKARLTDEHVKPKIFYASRTHSQLCQFINEIKKTDFANIDKGVPIKVTSLASRANLCVNPEVLKLKDPSAINERCMELQKETRSEKKCPFIKSKDINLLKEEILSTVHDIEDLVNRGRYQGACPYYAARLAIPEAELIVLPYNNLLHRETRQASSLDLRDNVIIIDEAHNILETICSIHSATVHGIQLIGSHSILSRYYQKYYRRMSPRNAEMVKTIVQCLTALIKYLYEPKKHLTEYESPKLVDLDQEENLDKTTKLVNAGTTLNSGVKICKTQVKIEEFMIDVSKFTGAANIERFNVFKIIDYFHRSQLARKLLGSFQAENCIDLDMELHGMSIDDPQDKNSPRRKKQKTTCQQKSLQNLSAKKKMILKTEKWELTNLSFLKESIAKTNTRVKKQELVMSSYPIYTMIEFLRSLTNLADDGKILTIYREGEILTSTLKFILLNPSSQFKQMTQEARSIVLAGGTMQPFEEFKELLFGPLGVDEGRVQIFSCGHVISKDHLHVVSLNLGPTGKQLELSYRTKNCWENIDEIGRTIFNISIVVPGGMVCFLPSYDYEQICYNRWAQTGVISKIETRSKHVFREPRQASQLRSVWDQYCRMIEKGRTNNRGALLFCVVGGKMSEGINFNDDLGRCVLMVGLPYANIKSGELQQKMSYYDRTCPTNSKNSLSAGQLYYENLCIKGINQTIGRAIRHKNDYAAIVLLDHRYKSKTNIKMGLPGWIRDSLHEYDRFGPMFSQLKTFYDTIKTKQPNAKA